MDDLWGFAVKLAGVGLFSLPVTLIFAPDFAAFGLSLMLPLIAMVILLPIYALLTESTGWMIVAIFVGLALLGGQIPGCERDSYRSASPSAPPYCSARYGCD